MCSFSIRFHFCSLLRFRFHRNQRKQASSKRITDFFSLSTLWAVQRDGKSCPRFSFSKCNEHLIDFISSLSEFMVRDVSLTRLPSWPTAKQEAQLKRTLDVINRLHKTQFHQLFGVFFFCRGHANSIAKLKRRSSELAQHQWVSLRLLITV